MRDKYGETFIETLRTALLLFLAKARQLAKMMAFPTYLLAKFAKIYPSESLLFQKFIRWGVCHLLGHLSYRSTTATLQTRSN